MLEAIGYTPDLARWAAAADARVGRVVRVDRGVARVLTEDGPLRASLGGAVLDAMAHEPTAAPCTGDWVVVRDWPDRRTTLERVLPRRTAVVRAGVGRRPTRQLLCTNVDHAAVVVSLHPAPTLPKVERMVAMAWDSGARPLVLLTKADLVADADLVAEDVTDTAPGVEVLCASTVTGRGISRLRALVGASATLGLFGTSGHGKSSLVNALVGAETLATRGIRADGRGRHTSVRRELVPLPGGGAVIDTPGLRVTGLADSGAGVAALFSDVEELAAGCRFRDCSHRVEPGCAVRAALADGRLSQRRFESWTMLLAEVRRAAGRQ